MDIHIFLLCCYNICWECRQVAAQQFVWSSAGSEKGFPGGEEAAIPTGMVQYYGMDGISRDLCFLRINSLRSIANKTCSLVAYLKFLVSGLRDLFFL